MSRRKSPSNSILSIRLDDISSAHLDYICGKTGLSRSVAFRRMLSYIDDHDTPVGHLSDFIEYSNRADEFIRAAFTSALGCPSKLKR